MREIEAEVLERLADEALGLDAAGVNRRRPSAGSKTFHR